MSTKKTTKTNTVNSLPSWLTSPYQAATQAATKLYETQPGIGAGTQASLDQINQNAETGRAATTGALGSLSAMAGGNFSGSALDKFTGNGMLDTGYIDESRLNATANGDFLSPDSNPFIKGVADRAADTAQGRINAQFGSAGRSNGSGLYAQLFGQGISDSANSVYAANYENERQRQQAAQGTLLGAQQTARESALGRQYGASGAELNAQLQSSAQIPAMLQAMMNGDIAAFTGNQYQDNAPYNNLAKYTGLLSTLGAPYAIQDSTTKQKTGGLGAVAGTVAQVGGALAGAAMGNPFAALGLGGAAGGLGGGLGSLTGGLTNPFSLQSLTGLSGSR